MDFVADFFCSFLVGKSAQKNPPAKFSQIYTAKIPHTFFVSPSEAGSAYASAMAGMVAQAEKLQHVLWDRSQAFGSMHLFEL